jgi:hypothetical protein
VTFSLADDLPEGSGSPAMGLPRLHDGEALQVSGGEGEEANEGERDFQRAPPVYIQKTWARSSVGVAENNWAAWAVSGDGVVS